ncbi:Hypothetical protein A7982_03391 [Minicystis rosea]|nr:Hypothetical protein A7982_03391 [Minicystis rosea]
MLPDTAPLRTMLRCIASRIEDGIARGMLTAVDLPVASAHRGKS